MKFIWIAFLLIAAPFCYFYALSFTHPEVAAIANDTVSPNILEKIVNDYRSSLQLNVLKESANLCNVADLRLEQIKSDFSHNAFYAQVDNNVIPNLYQGVYYGENLARGLSSNDEVFNGWLSSAKHKELLERTEWKDFCVRTSQNFTVLIFGQPK